MSEFFDTGTIAEEHIVSGIHNAIREDRLFPVLFASGLGNIGSDEILDFILDYVPSATERKTFAGVPATAGAEPPVAQDRRLRAALALRLQDRQRSLRRTHLLLQGRQRRPQE